MASASAVALFSPDPPDIMKTFSNTFEIINMNNATRSTRIITSCLALAVSACLLPTAAAQDKKDTTPPTALPVSPTAIPVLTEGVPPPATAPTKAPAKAAAPVIAASASGVLELPDSAAPAKELLPLNFMVGRWISVNPNKSVNEEHWSAPRGNNMAALFRQLRRDGKPGLFEVSLITAEAEGVVLRLRHLHGQLEIPTGREEVSIFKLKSAENNRAEFTGTGKAEQVTSVVYRLVSPDQLAMEITFAPTSKEKGYTSLYTREGKVLYAPAAAKPAAGSPTASPRPDAASPKAAQPAPTKPVGK